MTMSANDVLKMIKEHEVKFVDFRFTDTRGKEQHVGVPAKLLTPTSSRKVTPSTVLPSPAGRASRLPTCC